jgi:hypothetical protein
LLSFDLLAVIERRGLDLARRYTLRTLRSLTKASSGDKGTTRRSKPRSLWLRLAREGFADKHRGEALRLRKRERGSLRAP